MKLALSSIRIDGGTQPRAQIDLGTVNEYAEAMTDGSSFPAVIVFFDGVEHWLADGFHRYHAARQIDAIDIEADVKTGTQRDAVLCAVGANAAHGQRRTNADKRRAVLTLLQDEEWSKWSDSEVARRCFVSQDLVSTLHRSLNATVSDNRPGEHTYTDKHGNVGTMNTSKIGHGRVPRPEPPAEPVSDAMQFAEIALSQLSRIQRNDPRREEALRQVLVWIRAELGEETL